MTYDRMSTYITWGGSIGSSGDDRWQCGVHVALDPSHDGPGLPTTAELQDLLDDIISPFHSQESTYISPGCFLSWAKAASLDNAGEYTAEPVYVTRTALAGGAPGTNKGGPQVAACFTLWSGQTLGQANYGRFYVPWCEAGVGNDGRILGGLVSGMLANGLTLVTGINDFAAVALSATARVRIMSKLGTGATKRAAYLRLGNVKDTQQRRRRQIAETYSVDVIPV